MVSSKTASVVQMLGSRYSGMHAIVIFVFHIQLGGTWNSESP